MTVIESLTPHESSRVMDLVESAGVDVKPWAWSAKANGPFKTPASNPAYCYEWAFIERGRVVVLNIWHGQIRDETEMCGVTSICVRGRRRAETQRDCGQVKEVPLQSGPFAWMRR